MSVREVVKVLNEFALANFLEVACKTLVLPGGAKTVTLTTGTGTVPIAAGAAKRNHRFQQSLNRFAASLNKEHQTGTSKCRAYGSENNVKLLFAGALVTNKYVSPISPINAVISDAAIIIFLIPTSKWCWR